MNAEDAWKELTEKFGWLERDGEKLLYFWEPEDNVPVDARFVDDADRDRVRSLEDIPLAYAVTTMANATGQTVIYAKWERHGWEPNPWNKRHLIRHLVDRLNNAPSVGLTWVAE